MPARKTPLLAIEIVTRADPAGGWPSADTAGRVIYAVGDIHGRYDLLSALLDAIIRDWRSLKTITPPLVLLLGDYVDRGPDSAAIVATLVWLARHGPFDVAFLKGNHEAMLLAFLQRPYATRAWLRFGGRETLRSYEVAVDDDEEIDEAACERLRDALLDRMPASHLELLRGLPTELVYGDYAFVHAGFRPGVPLAKQDDDDRLWIRSDFLNEDTPFEKIVVHGHSWSSADPALTAHRLGIDTGAYSTGVLTAARLGTPDLTFIQACGTASPAAEIEA